MRLRIIKNRPIFAPGGSFQDKRQDINEAQKEAENYMKWMERQMKDLDKAMNTTPPEEDVKANAEFEQKAIMAEEAKEVFDGGNKTEEGQV